MGERTFRRSKPGKIAALLCAAAAMGLAPGAVAQSGQTAAGAQEFLRIMAAQGSMAANIDRGGGWNRVFKTGTRRKCQSYDEVTLFGTKRKRDCFDEPFSEMINHGTFPIAVQPASQCGTRISLGDPGYSRGADLGSEKYTVSEPDLTPIVLDWSKVTRVMQSGTLVEIVGAYPRVAFIMASEDLAARAAYASEFLRSNCDAAAHTAF